MFKHMQVNIILLNQQYLKNPYQVQSTHSFHAKPLQDMNMPKGHWFLN